MPGLERVLHNFLGLRALPLPQRDTLLSVRKAHFLRESQKVRDRIGPRGQHENERRFRRRVFKALLQVKRRRDYELLPHNIRNPLLNGRDDLVRPDALQQNNFLKLIKLRVERRGHFLVLWRLRVENGFKVIRFLQKLQIRPVEHFEPAEPENLPVKVRPGVFADPGGGVWLNLDFPRGPGQKVPPFDFVYQVVGLEDLNREHQAEKQLVLLEERPADVLVERVGQIVV